MRSGGVGQCFEASQHLVLPKQVSAVDLAGHVLQVGGNAVCHDHICFCLELDQVGQNRAVEKAGLLEGGLVNDDFHALGFDAFHDTLDAAGPEVVGIGLHD